MVAALDRRGSGTTTLENWEALSVGRPAGQLRLIPLGTDEAPTVECEMTPTSSDLYLTADAETGADPVPWFAALWQVSCAEAATRIVVGSPDLRQAVIEGMDDARQGRFLTWDEVFGED